MKLDNLTIGMRLVVMMLGITWAISLLIGTWSSLYLYYSMGSEIQSRQEALRDSKTTQLEQWYGERFSDIEVLTQSTDVFEMHNRVYQYRLDMEVGDQERVPTDTPAFQEIWETGGFLELFSHTYGYYDLFLISATNGHVIYTVEQESDIGANLRWGPLQESGLGECWATVIETGDKYLTDFSNYAPSNNEPAQFLGAPLFVDNKVKGVVVLQIPQDQVDFLLHSDSGLGKTGDILLVGDDFLLRNNSRQMALAGNENTCLSVEVRTEQVERGLRGETGFLKGKNPGGDEVLSAYGNVVLGEQTWALVSEINVGEAYAPLRRLLLVNGLVIITLSVIAVFFVTAFSKTISVPLKRITENAKLMAGGDFSQAIVELTGKDEISDMTRALKKMQYDTGQLIESLNASNEELEQQSEELAASNEELEQQSEELAATNQELEQQSEEIAATNEELEQQSEELAATNQELEQQSEEVSAANQELEQQSEELAATNEELEQQSIELMKSVDELEVTNIKAKAIQVSALDCIVAMNHEGQITEFNPAAEDVFGYTREEALGQDLAETIIPPKLREQHRKGLERYMRTGRGHVLGERIEITGKKKDGTEFPVELAITASFAGDRHFFTAYLRDISERKRQEQEINQAVGALEDEVLVRQSAEAALLESVAELANSNKELEDFAYIASHDLKEPLRGISNYSTFLVEDYAEKLDEEGIRMLETLPRLTRRLEQLIDDLLNFSRVGRLELAIDDVDLDKVIDEVIESVQIRLDEQNVEVTRPRLLPVTRCDSVRVAEVFRNLVTNGMKYNDKAEKQIEIGWRDDYPGYPGTVFYVRDNGIGIPEKHVDKIFTMFKRLHARDKYGGGTGAGMTIAKKIIERHNGAIWLESQVGQGTTFYFTLNRKWE